MTDSPEVENSRKEGLTKSLPLVVLIFGTAIAVCLGLSDTQLYRKLILADMRNLILYFGLGVSWLGWTGCFLVSIRNRLSISKNARFSANLMWWVAIFALLHNLSILMWFFANPGAR